MKKIMLLFLFLSPLLLNAQSPSLQQCIDSALQRYPLIHQKQIYAQIVEEELANIKASNLPQANLSAQATWQSQVTELPITIPGINIPSLNQDQYRAQIELKQMLYKGGADKAQKQLIATNHEISNVQVEIELQNIKRKVVNLYFQSLMFKKSMEMVKSQMAIFDRNISDGHARVDAGVLLSSSLDLLKAERISLEENYVQLEYGYESLLAQLSFYSGFTSQQLSKMEAPTDTKAQNTQVQRPELKLFDYNMAKMHGLASLQKSMNMPKAFAFSNLGLGRPGLNMLSNDFSPYAIIGVGFQWKIWDWKQQNRKIQILNLQIQAIEYQKNSFDFTLQNSLLELQAEINKQAALLKVAQDLLPLRQSYLLQLEAQYKEGTALVSDYVDAVKKVESVAFKIELAKLKVALAQINYRLALGEL
jgi:outer membrane protein TolC